ncbi:DUF4912 domain-containing protein [Desmonostoc muscorum LEGE 12446]|uniref:DUF4912 domain-containing protein n=1 Tax=Desmonostoc muscorum LEGE 12446 TaxID=1828758 RepID=A0A8J6ZWA2_DESMC|nr:DUF4912 domain-containing protein [Desmonostoc muscorum]MCF2149652.1 DUF4912 domain-containing protein [Desmonostoc muscorum LEGE 12446]
MWQQEKKDTSIVKLVLWVALATTPMAATLVVSAPILAQSAPETPSFPLPQTVENGTTVRIDGSSSLAAINQSLKDNFEKQFSGTKVEIAASGTDTALKDLLDGKIDIAAIGRGLTPAEKALGLEQVRLRREKIAIVVGAENPFKQSLTSRQFARIFRGQITNWSQLGGPDAKIRVIDRPETSDTRDTFRDYPAFKAAKFATGSNATQLTDDNTAEIVKQLGNDGISYVLANQISKLEGVRVLQLHQTLPDDAKYPFSQPLVYIYKKNPSLGTASFLGFTLAAPGQEAIEQARTAEALAIAASVSQPAATSSPSTETTPTATTSPDATTSVFEQKPFVAPAEESEKAPIVNRETPFWLLLPLFVTTVAGGLLWWVFGRRPSVPEKTDNSLQPNPYPPSTDGVETAVNPSTTLELEEETPDRTPFQIYGQTSSDLIEETSLQQTSNGTTPSVALSENNNLGAAALMGGAALATGIGTATWSSFGDKETETKEDTIEDSNNTEISHHESGEVAWDIEAPAAVVNTPYPQLGNIPEEISDVELPLSEETNPLPELTDVPKGTSDFEYWDTEVSEDAIQEELKAELEWLESITSTEDPPLSESGEVVTDELPLSEETSPLSELPEDAFNVVADAAEPPVELLEEESPDFAAAAALAAGAGIGAWASTVDNAPIAAETANGLVDAQPESTIVLTQRSHRSADVSWEISSSQKSALRQQGVSQLLVRLYDVTGIDLSYQIPQLVEQYESEELLSKSLDIPAGDRDYIAEIGYLAEGDRWFPIAHSAIVRVFSPVEPDPIVEDLPVVNQTADAEAESTIVLTQRSHRSADVSWEISESRKSALRQQGVSQLLVRLYDATGIDLSYQTPRLVEQYESEELLSKNVDIPATDRDYIAEIGYLPEGDRWFPIARSAIVHVFSPVEPDPIIEDLPMVNQTADVEEASTIVLTPRTYTSADVSWEISESQKSALRQQGVSQLLVRLYDATGIDLSYQTPRLIEQYESEELLSKSLDIPTNDRDYIAEIGYIAEGDRWFSIARSAIVRVFSPVEPDPTAEDLPVVNQTSDAEQESTIILTPRTPKWAYVWWCISPTQKQALRQQGGSQLAVRVYDVTGIDLSYQTPQLVQQYECEEVTTDRFVAIPVSDRDYMAEIGYLAEGDRWLTIARSANIRVFSRPEGDFWFVADAELIIHGATEPNTTVAIGGNTIKIKPDGTFHLRLPFSDGLMDYLITVAPDGESAKTIHKKFSQETSEI